MLRNINPLLSPDLLYHLRAMGHGDEIVNGPACIRLDGISASDVLEAVLSVMPLDTFVEDPALSMQVVGNPDETPPTVEDFQKILETTADHVVQIKGLERYAFYERASKAFAVVQTGEMRPYGNIILKKGIIIK